MGVRSPWFLIGPETKVKQSLRCLLLQVISLLSQSEQYSFFLFLVLEVAALHELNCSTVRDGSTEQGTTIVQR
jgi:hypothetical protein